MLWFEIQGPNQPGLRPFQVQALVHGQGGWEVQTAVEGRASWAASPRHQPSGFRGVVVSTLSGRCRENTRTDKRGG